MRRRFLAVCATLAVASTGVAQMKPQPLNPIRIENNKAEEAAKTAPRISRDEARKLVNAGKAVFVDVRSEHSFETAHIKGALSIPGSQLAMRITELPPKKMIITYCACHAEETAGLAVAVLKAHGLKKAAALKGGWNEWRDANLPMEGVAVR